MSQIRRKRLGRRLLNKPDALVPSCFNAGTDHCAELTTDDG